MPISRQKVHPFSVFSAVLAKREKNRAKLQKTPLLKMS
jgi:hypothetical protein